MSVVDVTRALSHTFSSIFIVPYSLALATVHNELCGRFSLPEEGSIQTNKGFKKTQSCIKHANAINQQMLIRLFVAAVNLHNRGGGVLPYMGHIGMCCCEGYGFQSAYCGIRYTNYRVWDQNRDHFPGNCMVNIDG